MGAKTGRFVRVLYASGGGRTAPISELKIVVVNLTCNSAIAMLLPYGTRYPMEPISERLSVHLDRNVETLSLASRTLF